MRKLWCCFGCPTTVWVLFHGKGLLWAAFVHLEAGCMQYPCKLKPLCLLVEAWCKWFSQFRIGAASSASPYRLHRVSWGHGLACDTMRTTQILWCAFVLELLGWDTQNTATTTLCAAASDLEERGGSPPSVYSRISWLCFQLLLFPISDGILP